MEKTRVVKVALIAILLGGIGPGFAAEKGATGKPPAGMPGMEQMPMGRGMMGGGMMDMMHMMGACSRMMGGGMMGGAMMPQLPPGNEKLQLQMQAEMLQKMGEIAARYAEHIKTDKR